MENLMSTGIESWPPVKEITTLSPFAGSEVLFTIIAVVVWIGWQVWQIKNENNSYDEQTSKLQGNLSKAISGD